MQSSVLQSGKFNSPSARPDAAEGRSSLPQKVAFLYTKGKNWAQHRCHADNVTLPTKVTGKDKTATPVKQKQRTVKESTLRVTLISEGLQKFLAVVFLSG